MSRINVTNTQKKSIGELKSEQAKDTFCIEVNNFLKKENCCTMLKYDLKDFLSMNNILYKKLKIDTRLKK